MTDSQIFRMPLDELERRIKDDELLISSFTRWLEREKQIIQLVREGKINEEIKRQEDRIEEIKKSKSLKEAVLLSKQMGVMK